MAFTADQTKALDAPLNAAHVKTREQAGRKLSYIEGWHAISEANRIFGFDAWTRETLDIRCVSEKARMIGKKPYEREGWGVSYVAKVRVTVDGVVREGIGAGHGIDADIGLAHESAIKEAETDAMKRALMTFGNPFGLALYDKEQSNVERDDAVVKDLCRALQTTETENDLALWYTGKKDQIDRLSAADKDAVRAAYKTHMANLRSTRAAA